MYTIIHSEFPSVTPNCHVVGILMIFMLRTTYVEDSFNLKTKNHPALLWLHAIWNWKAFRSCSRLKILNCLNELVAFCFDTDSKNQSVKHVKGAS